MLGARLQMYFSEVEIASLILKGLVDNVKIFASI
jgi:hypothetical protein